MTKIILALLATLALASVTTAKAGVKEIGTVNGVKIVRVKSLGIFCPSTTTILKYTPGQPGVETVQAASNPGVVPSVAQAGGIVGGAALLRPSRTKVTNGANSGSSSTATGSGTATGGNGGGSFVPPGHVNNPSHNN